VNEDFHAAEHVRKGILSTDGAFDPFGLHELSCFQSARRSADPMREYRDM
jgi:hypothetical protein